MVLVGRDSLGRAADLQGRMISQFSQDRRFEGQIVKYLMDKGFGFIRPRGLAMDRCDPQILNR